MSILRFFTFICLIFSIQSFSQDWLVNIELAKSRALAEDKSIVLVFQGSDWCAPCMKLDREIWSTKEFQNLAQDSFIMLKADFPRRKQNQLSEEQKSHNNKLAEQYNTYGYFPYVVVLDAKGKALGSIGYEKSSPKIYYNKLKSFAN
ncbi:thioredoxin family protein [Winogradskyella vincentii]|uniref:Thioredoxin family protein n=1 Tax=Winogradskyella vincentii TaxID=2877122 RepID=A0ABS7Y2T7_9FLAO|nr:thioredoxin family protein [Winogradskyella vincentii]MCA0153162.1 thioredoxin family protein [Winogradskyella vincentii]